MPTSSDDLMASATDAPSVANGAGSGIPLQTSGILPPPSLTFSDDTDTPTSDPTSADFDFDAFFNELSSRQPPLDGSNDYGDVMDTSLGDARFDPVMGMDPIDPSGVDDSQQERLTAFLEDAGSSAASPLVEKTPVAKAAGGPAGKKRKSDVHELPPLVNTEEAPKPKKRR